MLGKIVDNSDANPLCRAPLGFVAATLPHFGDILRLRRDERSWTQDALARKSGVSSATIYRAEQAAAKGEPIAPWKARYTIAVIAALHKQERLTVEQLTAAVVAAGTPEADRPEVEHAIRKKAGEFDGLQERIHAQSQAANVSLLDEIAATANPSIMELQYIVFELCQHHPIDRVRAALLGMKAALNASLPLRSSTHQHS